MALILKKRLMITATHQLHGAHSLSTSVLYELFTSLLFLVCSNELMLITHWPEIAAMSGTLLDEGQVRYLVECIKEVITKSSNRRTDQIERSKAEVSDAETTSARAALDGRCIPS